MYHWILSQCWNLYGLSFKLPQLQRNGLFQLQRRLLFLSHQRLFPLRRKLFNLYNLNRLSKLQSWFLLRQWASFKPMRNLHPHRRKLSVLQQHRLFFLCQWILPDSRHLRFLLQYSHLLLRMFRSIRLHPLSRRLLLSLSNLMCDLLIPSRLSGL